MAGFDFNIACTSRQQEFLRPLLRFAQQTARYRGCAIRYRTTIQRSDGRSGYYATADGHLTELQALAVVFADKLFPYAEALASDLRRSERVALADRLLDAYIENLHNFMDFMTELAKLHEQAEIDFVARSYIFDVGAATHLKGRTKAFTQALLMYHEGRLADVHIIEECHTMLELLLKATFRQEARQLSFKELVQLAHKQGILSESLKDAIVRLNSIRRMAKHQGQGVPGITMVALFPHAIEACQRLTAVLRRHSTASRVLSSSRGET